ncbi:MAG TPA: outer membrane beta-barrel protein [Vicinamibacteria bacterium]|nr:outer membrane beta-barrel protein [Vicinamibacteria bacterium]
MRPQRLSPLAALVVLFAAPPPAAPETLLTATIGRAFGGDLEQGELSYGASIGFMGDGIVGFEVEGVYTPDVFGDTPAGTNNITTLMGNLLLGAPLGEAGRIYAKGGVGIMKFRVPDVDDFFDIDSNDFGMNAGAGVMVNLGERFALKGEIAYFRNLEDPEPDNDFDVDFGGFSYWRGSAGLSLRF